MERRLMRTIDRSPCRQPGPSPAPRMGNRTGALPVINET
jgi:hypothetical protein